MKKLSSPIVFLFAVIPGFMKFSKIVTIILIIQVTFCSCRKNHSSPSYKWEKISYPLDAQFLDVQFINHDTGFILALSTDFSNFNNSLLKTTDGGSSWSYQTSPVPEPGGIGLMFAYNSQLIFGGKDGVFKTVDEGASWQGFDSAFNSIGNLTNGIHFFDPLNGIVINGGTIFKTADGGNHLYQVANNATGMPFYQMQFVTPDVGYVRGGNPRNGLTVFTKTIDGGTTWSEIPFTPGYMNNLYFISIPIGYCLVGQNLFKTTDGGISWTKQNTSPVGNNNGGKLLFLNESEGFLMTVYGELFHTSNSGKTWSQELFNEGLQFNDITSDGERVFIVGEKGTILSRNHN